MRPLDYPLLADENIHPEIVQSLRDEGKDIETVQDMGLLGRADVEILRRAVTEGRVVLTHDSDFGTLALRCGEPFIGIIYLRPGHISAKYVLGIIATIATVEEVHPPFLLVAERKDDRVRLRLRSAPPPD